MKSYRIFDIRMGLLRGDVVAEAKSPLKAVKKLYKNVRMVANGSYCYEGEKK